MHARGNPMVDPRPGDIVRSTVCNDHRERHVVSREGGNIYYKLVTEKKTSDLQTCWIKTWKDWCRRNKVAVVQTEDQYSLGPEGPGMHGWDLRQNIKDIIDERFYALEAAIITATGNRMSGNYMMKVRQDIYSAVYLGNSATRKRRQNDGTYI